MRGRGVDHSRPRIGDQPHRLTRGIVGQAQDHEIGRVERLGARGGILAPRRVDLDQREVVAAGEALADFEPGRSRRAADENRDAHACASCGPAPTASASISPTQLGRAASRERVCWYVSILVAPVAFKTKHTNTTPTALTPKSTNNH